MVETLGNPCAAPEQRVSLGISVPVSLFPCISRGGFSGAQGMWGTSGKIFLLTYSASFPYRVGNVGNECKPGSN
jgi:hypothetical protein